MHRIFQWDTSVENIQSSQSNLVTGEQPQQLAIIVMRFLALLAVTTAILAMGWNYP